MKRDNHQASAYKRLLLQTLNGDWADWHDETCSIQDCADGALNALRTIADRELLPGVDGSALVTERAKFLGFRNPGQVSANGTCRLIHARDDWIALSLAREEDWKLIPAWLEEEVKEVDWPSIASRIRSRSSAVLADRGRMMGLPVTVLNSCQADRWVKTLRKGRYATSRKPSPLVIDLSSLWAGPLCTHLLLQAGATVIKVESSTRLDTTRDSSLAFHNLINSGKFSVVLDFENDADTSKLAALLRSADIVVESTRPRALRHLGIEPEQLVERLPGLTWVSITGYGRTEPEANWVAFGDDAAIAAGAAVMKDAGPEFVGDALGDPLTGIHAAVAALFGWQSGRGSLLDLSLAGVTSFIMKVSGSTHAIDLEAEFTPRVPTSEAPHPGDDTDEILREFAGSCC
jgi:hypothetical protein